MCGLSFGKFVIFFSRLNVGARTFSLFVAFLSQAEIMHEKFCREVGRVFVAVQADPNGDNGTFAVLYCTVNI